VRRSRAPEENPESRGRRVLGVDPGTVVTGWGVVEENGSGVRHVASGVIRPRGTRADRLSAIHRALCEVCESFQPTTLSLEQTFVGDNVQTAFRLGEARGAAMVAAAAAGLSVTEYSPAEIKVAVAGTGRAAKAQMQAMVGRLLELSERLATDQADALGAAICHLQTSRFTARVAPLAVSGGRLGRGRRRAQRFSLRR
jgi:crossover junction endodeoxyribonuclease RuvC